MLFEQEIFFKSNTEKIEMEYSWKSYKNLRQKEIYPESYFDKIDRYKGGIFNHHFIRKKVKMSLFLFLCDILSVDYEELVQELCDYLNKNDLRNFCAIDKIICKYHFALALPEIIFRLQDIGKLPVEDAYQQKSVIEPEYISACFMPQILLLMYIYGMENFEKLKEPDVFRLFAHDAGSVNILPQKKRTTEHLDYYSYDYLALSNQEKKEATEELFNNFVNLYKLEPEYIFNIHNSLEEYCYTTFYLLLEKGYAIKKCKNCGKYFVPLTRSDTLYCDRTSLIDKTKSCGEYAKYKNYLEKTRSNEAVKLYKQIYNCKRNKILRTENKKLKQELDNFISLANQWKSDVKEGIKKETDYLDWLKFVKEGDING